MSSTIATGTENPSARSDAYRRALDIGCSAVLVLLTLPILVVTAVGSTISLRAWPFFSQDRVGRDGELFRFLKLRTLPVSVPAYIDKHQLADHSIPRFCRFLRSFHLDEVPQLLLVLVGRMSLVGPRPEMACLHEQMPAGFAAERTGVRPGCTGLWQISESCTGLIGDAPEYDRFYLTHRTLRLDVWVLALTAAKMIGVRACITLDQVPDWTLPSRRRADASASPPLDRTEPSLSLPAAAGR